MKLLSTRHGQNFKTSPNVKRKLFFFYKYPGRLNSWMPGTTLDNNREIPKKITMRRKCGFKRLISHCDMNIFPGVVWKLPKYFNIYLLGLGLLYLAVKFLAIFSKSDDVFHWNGTSICVFTNIMNNSAQLKDNELRMLVLFLLIILEMCSLLTLECAPCVCFFGKLWICEKIRSKFLKAWEMKNLL